MTTEEKKELRNIVNTYFENEVRAEQEQRNKNLHYLQLNKVMYSDEEFNGHKHAILDQSYDMIQRLRNRKQDALMIIDNA